MKIDLKDIRRVELSKILKELGIVEKYRSKQIFNWIYQRGILDFFQMSNIKKSIRNKLNDNFYISSLLLAERKQSNDGTIKYLFELEDGEYIESVFIPGKQKATICISTQVGCKMGCKFCQTAGIGFKRNLYASEIINQVYQVKMDNNNTPLLHTNIVFMGMGEPFDNYDNVIKAIQIMNDNEGLQIGLRRITVSTCGLVDKIYKAAELGMNFGLAISLNAADDQLRSQLMPVNNKFPIKDIVNAAKYFYEKTGRRVTFEYIVFPGINDRPEDIENLYNITRNVKCKINLIGYNSTYNQFTGISNEDLEKFREKLANKIKQTVTIRKSRGGDIQAACGQLYAKYKIVKKERRGK